MNKVDLLLKQLCPDGVSSQTVGDLCQIKTGKKDVNQGNPNGQFPFFTCSRNHTYSDSYSFDGEALLIAGNGDVGLVQYFNGKFEAYQRTYVLMNFQSVLVQFLSHYLRAYLVQHLSVLKQDGTIPYIKLSMLKDFKIPVPPIEIQQEIVTILDKFRELDSGLNDELEARKLQFEFFRDEAMSHLDDTNSKKVSISECAGIFDGTHQTPTYISEGVKFVSVENIDSLESSSKYISKEDYEVLYKTKPQKGDLLMTRIGSVGRCAVIDVDEPLAYYVSLALIKTDKKMISSQFLKHYLESHSGRLALDKKTLHHAVPLKINLGDIGKVQIRVPNSRIQEEVTTLLDKFQEYIYSPSSGLLAEINARQLQFEYYRNKLLTFKELGVA